MTAHQEIEHLQERHHHLEEEIQSENARPSPDDLKISALKKEKLRIKDQIQLLQTSA